MDGSGLSYIINEGRVLTSGSSAPDHHLKQTRYVHQEFLLAGSKKLSEAHQVSACLCQKESWAVATSSSPQQFTF